MSENSNRTRYEPHHVAGQTVPVDAGVLELQIDQERIARRAYAIYESRHRADGHADEDWFQAAAEYAARPQRQPNAHDASSSLSERIRNARR